MESASRPLKAMRSWYVLWAALLAVSAHNVTTGREIAKWVLLVSVVLAVIALTQAKHWHSVLGERKTALAWCVFALYCFGQLGHFAVVQTGTAKFGYDFSAYYLAGKVVQEEPRGSLYDAPLPKDASMVMHLDEGAASAWTAAAHRYNVPYATPFIYPPFMAALMAPFAHLSFAAAFAVWNAMTLLLVAGAMLLSFHLTGVRMDGRLALLCGVGLLSFYPFVLNLFCGQIGGVMLFLLAASVWLLARGQTWLSALSLAIATLIKLTPVVAVPVLVVHRRWRWLAAYTVWMVALAAASVRVTGRASYMEFWHTTLPAISCGSAVWENTSIVAWVQELFLGYVPRSMAMTPAAICQISKLVAMALFAAFLLLYWVLRKEQDVVRGFIAVSLVSFAISPITWWHHYTIAILPLVYLWCTMRDRVGRVLLACLTLVVGTNIVRLIGLVWPNGMILPALAGVAPILTIALAFAAIGERQATPPEAQTTMHIAAL